MPERYKLLFETSSDAMMTVAPPGWKFTSGNPAAIKMFRVKDEKDFTSQDPGELSPEFQPDGKPSRIKSIEMINTAMEKGSYFFEWTHKRVTGEEFPATVLLSRISQGGKTYLQATVRDITADKQASQKIKELADAWDRTFNAISDVIFIIDADHNITKANNAAYAMLGAEPGSLIGKKCFEVMHKLDKPWPGCPMEKVNTDKQPHVEEIDDPAIGVPLLVSTFPLFNEKGEYTGVVHVARDISERKRIENDLRKEIESLERFQKITVDRELKMKELKAEIADLKNKLLRANNGNKT
ncbi:MAG: PAS domain S-box protein [Candidatus Omnitrophica bacterium]|nr:PAS domain S-box protein [Candidatus Omnitrophota bacterium]